MNAYVIDTGIYRHTDLNRVKHVNFVGDGRNTDCHGHGTHVAGTLAAKDNTTDVVGVAPGAPLSGVKVLGCNGSGATSGVIKGVDWVTANARKPAIANMSLGGSLSQALDDAVRRSAASGIFYSIAAGNNGADACLHSPARAGAGTDNGIATVAATTSSDGEASWSNYGPCVDVWAPGVGILSTRKGGRYHNDEWHLDGRPACRWWSSPLPLEEHRCEPYDGRRRAHLRRNRSVLPPCGPLFVFEPGLDECRS